MKKTNKLKIVNQAVTPERILNLDAQEALSVFNSLSFEDKIGLVLSSPWLKRQQLIMFDENPTKLVQALPEDEVYWTIKEIGAEDALPIISRLSFDQLQYSIDIDCWMKDQIDMAGVTRWLRMLLRCNEENVLEWVTRTDERFLNFAFKKLFNVFRLSDDIDLAEASDQLPSWTIDGLYYFQFADDEARMIAIPFLHLLYKTDSKYFYYLMENTKWISAIELEEDVLRMRQRRMGEQGFPDLDEALQIYQYQGPEEIRSLLAQTQRGGQMTAAPASFLPKLRYQFTQITQQLFVHAVLQHIVDKQIADKIQRSIISLTNTVMIADCAEARDAGEKMQALNKVMGYVNIGLELLSGQDTDAAVRIMEEVPAHVLFRAGYSQALALKYRLQRFYGGLKTIPLHLPSDFFDFPWDETIAGLNRSRPVFFEGNQHRESISYREFESLEDIRATAEVLDIIEIIKSVLFDCFALTGPDDVAGIAAESTSDESSGIRAQQLFLTVLARHILYGKTELVPLSAEELQTFLSMVFDTARKNDDGSTPLKETLSVDTISWLRRQYSQPDDTLHALKAFVQHCLEALQQECGNLAVARAIETRYVSVFLFNA